MKNNTQGICFFKDKTLLLHVFIATFIFGIMAHGCAYFNTFFSHDGLAGIIQDQQTSYGRGDIISKIITGRFTQYFTIIAKGGMSPPWLMGIILMTWTALASYLLARMLQIKSLPIIYAICALIITSLTHTTIFAIYVHEADAFSLTLFLSIFCVYCIHLDKKYYYAAPVFIVLICSLYAPYLSVVFITYLLYLIKKTIDGSPVKTLLLSTLKFSIGGIIGIAAYLLLVGLVKDIFNLSSLSSYNNPVSIAQSTTGIQYLLAIPGKIYTALILIPIQIKHNPFYHCTAMGMILAFLGLVMAYQLIQIFRIKKTPLISIIFILAILAVIPIAYDFVNLLTEKPTPRNALILCATSILYIITLYIANTYKSASPKQTSSRNISLSISYLIIASSIIVSNQTYLQRQLAHDSTISIMTRVLSEIERTPNYQLGKTPTVIIGAPSTIEASNARQGFEKLHLQAGNLTATTHYPLYYNAYFAQILSYPLNVTQAINKKTSTSLPKQAQDMPVFPYPGYCRIIDDVLYIKFSNFLSNES